MPTPQDPHAVLGVARNATQREIREAYIARARIIHPDRFDRSKQPNDWKLANDMFVELNTAYEALRAGVASETPKPESARSPSSEAHAQKPPPPGRAEDLTAGRANFDELPKEVQARLLERQMQKAGWQVQFPLRSVAWNYVWAIVLGAWFVVLFFVADDSKWSDSGQAWLGVITLVVGGLIARNILTIQVWHRSRLKPHFYATPLYFIRTDRDNVTFWPLWTLSDLSVTHNHRNGSYQNTTIKFTIGDYIQEVTVGTMDHVQRCLAGLKRYDGQLRAAIARNDFAYIRQHDDFHGVSRREGRHVATTPENQSTVYILSVAIAAVAYVGALIANDHAAKSRWVSHPRPQRSIGAEVQAATRAVHPDQLLANSPPFQAAERAGREAAPAPQGLPASAPPVPPKPLPETGTVTRFTQDEAIAPFQVKGTDGTHFLLKLVSVSRRIPIATVFVRAGTTVEVDVPTGIYELRYAAGTTWYGDEYLFGPDTAYSKANRVLSFIQHENEVEGVSITLFKVVNGNLGISSIKPTDF